MIKLFITLANEPTGPMSGEYYTGIAHIIGKIYLSSPSKQLILELQLNSTNFETTRINLLDFPNSFVDCQAD